MMRVLRMHSSDDICISNHYTLLYAMRKVTQKLNHFQTNYSPTVNVVTPLRHFASHLQLTTRLARFIVPLCAFTKTPQQPKERESPTRGKLGIRSLLPRTFWTGGCVFYGGPKPV